MPSQHLESQTERRRRRRRRRKEAGRRGGIWWSTVTNHGWQIISSLRCLSLPPPTPLLSRQGWAKQQVVQKRSPDMGFTNLCPSDICTGQALAANLQFKKRKRSIKSKCCFWFSFLCCKRVFLTVLYLFDAWSFLSREPFELNLQVIHIYIYIYTDYAACVSLHLRWLLLNDVKIHVTSWKHSCVTSC